MQQNALTLTGLYICVQNGDKRRVGFALLYQAGIESSPSSKESPHRVSTALVKSRPQQKDQRCLLLRFRSMSRFGSIYETQERGAPFGASEDCDVEEGSETLIPATEREGQMRPTTRWARRAPPGDPLGTSGATGSVAPSRRRRRPCSPEAPFLPGERPSG